MNTSFWFAGVTASIGLLIVILPDQGEPVLRFSTSHGPSIQDLTGLVLIIGAWAFMVIKSIVKRDRVVKSIGKPRVMKLIGYLVLGSAAIALGLQLEKDFVLWLGVAISVVAYYMLFIPAFRSN